MQIAIIIAVVAATFGLCYFFDKVFQKLFRSKQQHRSGLAVRLNKMYGIAGIVLAFLGVCAIMTGIADTKILLYGGILVLVFGIGLCIYYLSFGIFYDENSFVYTSFSKKEATYRFSDIRTQQLYVITGGSIVVELHMADGKSVSVQSTMDGMYPFLDAAYLSWCREQDIDPESCAFHDPSNHLWFPTEEAE